MPKTVKNESFISPAFIAAAKLRAQKKLDYGGLEGYFPFGSKSYLQEINKKTLRLVTMEQGNVEPTFESVKDNLLDLLNYVSYYYEYLEDLEDQ